jgi:signal transduction histidine kinase
MVNIVENAIQYTPGGSIVLRTYACEGGVIMEVTDSGMGIPSEDIPHIFERFYRTHQARALRSGGTGLGLAIVSRIVDMHSGRIEVESQPDRGTIFRVWLPCAG